MKPKTVAVTMQEGGAWIPWTDWQLKRMFTKNMVVHAIKFEDGSIWDAVNGWREQ